MYFFKRNIHHSFIKNYIFKYFNILNNTYFFFKKAIVVQFQSFWLMSYSRKDCSPPYFAISLRTVSCSVHKQRCWWWPWRQPSLHLHSPARPGRWLPCTANCRWRCTFAVNAPPHSKRNNTVRETSSHLNWGVLRSTLRSKMCFPVEFTISPSTAFFSSSRPRPSEADMGSAWGSVNW